MNSNVIKTNIFHILIYLIYNAIFFIISDITNILYELQMLYKSLIDKLALTQLAICGWVKVLYIIVLFLDDAN